MNWNNDFFSKMKNDTMLTGIFCPCVLYGHNSAKFDTLQGSVYSSLWIPTTGYVAAAFVGMLSFGVYGAIAHNLGLKLSVDTLHCISSLGGNALIGCHAGNRRSEIRQKYGIDGTRCGDCLIHAVASPCALCQEYNELERQENLHHNVNAMFDVTQVPYQQVMTK